MSTSPIVDARGAVAEVELMPGEEVVYCLQADGLAVGARVGARLNVYFADAGYHRFFYEVAPAFARPGRPAYAARGGYNGSGIGLFADLRPTRHWHLRAGLNYRSVHGAAFEDSPLVVERNGVTVFLTLARSFLRSERRVPRERGDAMSTSTQ